MTEIDAPSGSATERLQALGLDLPASVRLEVREPPTVDSSVYVAGQLPYSDG